MAKADADPDASLKRLGGGRWQTRDERFTIEPQSGTWVIVDAAQTDELGLPLVRGPYPSLTAAKAAIAQARAGEPEASPLPARADAIRARTPTEPDADGDRDAAAPAAGKDKGKAPRKPAATAGSAEAPEPSWIAALAPDERRTARRLIRHLASAGVADPEGLVRRDLAGDVPALAGHAISVALDALGPDAEPQAVARLLADGRDDDLGVRWRLVDDRGRRISLDR
jgi:hypothetical protein